MFDAIAPRYDLVNRIMTLGLDTGWRRRAVKELGLAAGSTVLDVACGTGDFCRELEKAGLRAVGLDYSAGMLARARTSAPLVRGNALSLPAGDGSFDGITSGFALRNVTDLQKTFEEMARVLRPGGRIALLEVSRPGNPLMRAGHYVYFNRIVPLIGGLLSDRAAYRYLPASADYLPATEELKAMLTTAGLQAPRDVQLFFGAAQILTATR